MFYRFWGKLWFILSKNAIILCKWWKKGTEISDERALFVDIL